MPKYTKTQVTQLSANEQAALDQINKNFEDIQTAIADTVSRSGAIPTHMTSDLDMNGKKIINVPTPTVDTDLVRRKDVVGDIATVQNLVNTTTNAAAQTLAAAQAVQEVLEDVQLGIVADDLALGDDSTIRINANNIDDINTIATNIEDVNAVGDNISNVNAVADNETNINAVNSNKTNIDTVAGNNENINTVAAISSNVTSVANNSTNINSVASNETNINTCASNISAIIGASTQASNAAASANDAAESAALAQQYGNDKINQTHISNCITNIPQDIKLELDNGTLTLKAGSKVYVPNGFEQDGTTPKFDIKIVESDISQTFGSSTNTFLIYLKQDNTFAWYLSSVTGTTPPTDGALYNTSLNKVQGYNSGSLNSDNNSFPFCIVTISNGSVVSIDQVFNGFGYIGSTEFALPGVKGLIPNGRNNDGTLKNTQFETTNVLTYTFASNQNDKCFYGALVYPDNYLDYMLFQYPGTWYYDEKENYYKFNGVIYNNWFPFAKFDVTNGAISNWEPKTAFHALDYNDLNEILKPGMLAPYAGSYAPTGWLICDGSAVSRTTYSSLFSVIGTTYGTGDGSTTFNLPNISSIVTSVNTNVPIKGTGKSLGLTNGSTNCGLFKRADTSSLGVGSNFYNKNNGTSQSSAGDSPSSNTAIGVVTNASYSGIQGTVTRSVFSIKFIIKY